MVNTIDMQNLRYLNLFEKVTIIRTRFCFNYNEALVFCVPQSLIAKAIGENGKNVKKLQSILNRRVKIVPTPNSLADAETFIKAVINPITIRDFQVVNNEILVNAGRNKAALIGRNKRRLLEMDKATKGFFGKDFKVV